MAAQSGRDFVVKIGGAVVAGLRETSMSVDTSPIDITTKDDGGYRTLADFSGVESFEISFSGVWKADTIRGLALAGTSTTKLLTDITLEWGDGATLSGDMYLASVTSSGNHDGEEAYEGTFQSSGAWTYTAGS